MCARQESDLRPSGPQPDALSTELRAHLLYELSQAEGTLKYAAISRDCQLDLVRVCLLGQTGPGFRGAHVRGE